MRVRILLVIAMALFTTSAAQAQTAYPMLMSLKPVAAQVGQTSEHTVNSRYDLYGAYKIIVSGEGVTGVPVLPEVKKGAKPPTLTKLKVKFTVAPNAIPGVREFRIATPRGASTVGQLVIAKDAIVVESSKNNTASVATPIQAPCTICGTIEANEDVDYFKFKVTAGQTLSFHLRSMRLQNKIHDLQQHSDPLITLRNSSGSTLAACDNYFYGDPFLGHTFAQAGEYFLEVRDVRYHGNQYWEYSVEVSDTPFVSNVFPMVVARGKESKVQLVGANIPPDPMTAISLPLETKTGAQSLQLPMGDTVTNPVPVIVSDGNTVVETAAKNDSIETAQSVGKLPVGISGRIDSPADLDYFGIEAKKGEKFSFEVMARRWQSGLDSNLRILDAKGKRLSENDDLKIYKHSFADSLIENWTVPADGKYYIEIRDLHLGGGDNFVYFINITKSEPYFELYLDSDKTQLTPGTCGVLFANVVRKNGFAGDVQLHIEGLPASVKATCGQILANGRDGCIVLQSDPNAKPDMTNIRVWGTATQKQSDKAAVELTTDATVYQETYQPGGGRGHWPVLSHAICIGQPGDLRGIKLSMSEITLKKGESKKVEVTIERANSFSKNVQLDALFRHLSSTYANTLPAGVTIDSKNSKTLLTGKTVKGHITFTASDKVVPVERQQVSIMANISLNFVMKATYSSEPLYITIAK